MSSNIRTGRHCVFAMHVHLVFVAKYRKAIFDAKILRTMQEIFEKVCKESDAQLIEFNGETDHVHLVVNYPPKVSVSVLVNSLKGVSSRLLRAEYPILSSKIWRNALWSPSYFAGSCGGASLDVLKQYIEQQNRPN